MICAAHCVQGQVASLDAVSIFDDMNSDGNSDLNSSWEIHYNHI